MYNILLICSSGMSTSIMAKQMQEVANRTNVDARIWATGEALADEHIPKADIILLGPQISYLLEKVKDRAPNIPVELINMTDYGTMNGDNVLKFAIEKLENI